MRRPRLRTIAIASAALVVTGACASGPPADGPAGGQDAAVTEATTTTSDPAEGDTSNISAVPATATIPLPDDEAALVAVEAQWLCDVQRRSFTELSDVDEARASLLANSGVTADEYRAFHDRLESSTDLRLAVLAAFQTTCTA